MKVKVIEFNGNEDMFEALINEFIEDKKVIDIKYQTYFDNIFKVYSTLIMYEEIDK